MASQYYGRKGSTIRKYQRLLNSLGAKLNVDGIWGKKTEAAYNKYMDEFHQQLNPAPQAPQVPQPPAEEVTQPIEYEPRSEEALRQLAENLYGSLYSDQIEQAQRSAQGEQHQIEQMIDALTPQLAQRLQSLAEQYDRARQSMSDQALSRGLARSSYAADQLAGSHQRQLDAQLQLEQDAGDARRQLEKEIGQILSDLDGTTARLTADRQRTIAGAIDEYRQKDQTLATEALKYNNALAQQERDRLEQIRQFEENLKLQKKKIK